MWIKILLFAELLICFFAFADAMDWTLTERDRQVQLFFVLCLVSTSSGGESLQIIVIMWQNPPAGPRQTRSGLPRLEGDPCRRGSYQLGSGAERRSDARCLQLRSMEERRPDQGVQYRSCICSAADRGDHSHQPHHPEILSYLRGADCQSFQLWVDTECVFNADKRIPSL